MEEPEEEPEENPEGGPAMGQEVGPEVELEEYVVTDYKYGDSNQDLDDGKEIEETHSEPHLLEAPSDPRTPKLWLYELEKGRGNHPRGE
ncbi:unnamed protein product [Lactuca saligna]|uniref:Uncharacterized protein n=1 Tax=Lactuca saligna TaxID=75948 RepID=A0AA35YYN8_LACSI|nr:unnamed protein product [Lactuca saligna]